MTRDYLCEREQFGVKIGSFQALQHRLVDMFVEVQLSKSTAILGMIRVDSDDDLERKRAVSAAKHQLSKGGALVTRQGIQLHGGIGVTDEHNVGLYFKRMQILNALYGDEEHHIDRFSSLPSFTAGI
jgi:alkylation response protein AidB-like acyl-CoA dehydrogenase